MIAECLTKQIPGPGHIKHRSAMGMAPNTRAVGMTPPVRNFRCTLERVWAQVAHVGSVGRCTLRGVHRSAGDILRDRCTRCGMPVCWACWVFAACHCGYRGQKCLRGFSLALLRRMGAHLHARQRGVWCTSTGEPLHGPKFDMVKSVDRILRMVRVWVAYTGGTPALSVRFVKLSLTS
jgi:hypothetical protein